MRLQEKAKWSIGTALSQLLTDPLENASELLEAANSLQGPSPFPAPNPTPAQSVTPIIPATNAISGTTPDPGNAHVEFDFRPYLDNQYFEPGSYDDQMGTGSSAESFLPPQEFERLFSNPVKPALCPSVLKNVRDMMQEYPLELLRLPYEIANRSAGGVA